MDRKRANPVQPRPIDRHRLANNAHHRLLRNRGLRRSSRRTPLPFLPLTYQPLLPLLQHHRHRTRRLRIFSDPHKHHAVFPRRDPRDIRRLQHHRANIRGRHIHTNQQRRLPSPGFGGCSTSSTLPTTDVPRYVVPSAETTTYPLGPISRTPHSSNQRSPDARRRTLSTHRFRHVIRRLNTTNLGQNTRNPLTKRSHLLSSRTPHRRRPNNNKRRSTNTRRNNNTTPPYNPAAQNSRAAHRRSPANHQPHATNHHHKNKATTRITRPHHRPHHHKARRARLSKTHQGSQYQDPACALIPPAIRQ